MGVVNVQKKGFKCSWAIFYINWHLIFIFSQFGLHVCCFPTRPIGHPVPNKLFITGSWKLRHQSYLQIEFGSRNLLPLFAYVWSFPNFQSIINVYQPDLLNLKIMFNLVKYKFPARFHALNKLPWTWTKVWTEMYFFFS